MNPKTTAVIYFRECSDSRSLYLVLHLGLYSLFFTLFFFLVLENTAISFFDMYLPSVPTLLIEEIVFSPLRICASLVRLIDHKHVVYFWALYYVPLTYVSFFNYRSFVE